MDKIYEMDYKVIVSDINYGGHMGNERALIIFQQTRMEWLTSIGYDEADIEGKGMIQLESHVYYIKEVFMGENLRCRITGIEPERITFNINYEIINEANETAIKGTTKMAVFDYEKKKSFENTKRVCRKNKRV